MVSKSSVATDKARLIAYCDPELKQKLERLAELRFRSLSNLVESVVAAEIARAEISGELSDGSATKNEEKGRSK